MLNIDNYRFKIGSQNEVLNDVLIINPRLASRSLLLDFKNPWRYLSETPVASLCDAPHFGEKTNSETWLTIVDNVRTIIQRQNEYIYIPDLKYMGIKA